MSPQHDESSGCRSRNDLQLWKVAVNILNKQQQINDKGWSPSLGLGVGLTTLHSKKYICYEKPTRVSDLDGFFE
jgi:hypothetical protein